MVPKLVPFGMYLLMSLLVFSTHPFCQPQNVSVKYTFTSSFPFTLSRLVISSCAANSLPLSVVMVLTTCLLSVYPPLIHPSSTRLSHWYRALPVRQFPHPKGVGAPLHQGQDGMLPVVHYQVHLKVPESPSVRLCRTLVDARAVGDVRRLGLPPFPHPPAVFQLMRQVSRQPARRIRMYVIINGLRADTDAVFGEHAAYLAGRPMVFDNHLLHPPPQERVLAMVAQGVLPAFFTSFVGNDVVVCAVLVGVASQLAGDGRGVHTRTTKKIPVSPK